MRLELEGRGALPNVSFFAFTATPKGKPLQLFGTSDTGEEVNKQPFHRSSMQQAISNASRSTLPWPDSTSTRSPVVQLVAPPCTSLIREGRKEANCAASKRGTRRGVLRGRAVGTAWPEPRGANA